MAINYQPTTWNNEQEPPISADNLNHIEQGIKTTADRVDELVTVEANPSETPTDRLTALEVDGNIYEVGGGHKVYTDGGTLLPQQPNMVVKGVYSKDNATDNITEIEVVREFQNDAEVQALTGEEAKGFQHTPDNVYRARAAADITFDPTNTLLTQTRMQEALEELDAAHLPYSGTQNMKQKVDEKADNGYYPRLTITNNQGGTESNTAVLRTSGSIGQCEMAWVCQNASSEELTVALPTGWSFYRNGCFLARDVTNGVHVSVWSSSNGQVATYAHIGTMVVGHLYKLVLPATRL